MDSELHSLKIPPSTQSSSFPSPAISDCESLSLGSDQLSIYQFSAPPSTPATHASLFPPSPMSPSPWTPHMAQCPSPSMQDAQAEPWMEPYPGQLASSQSPVGWTLPMAYSTSNGMQRAVTPLSSGDCHHTHRSSVSSNDASFTRDGSEPMVKVESHSDWGYPSYPYPSSLAPHPTLTVSPQSLSNVPVSSCTSSPGGHSSLAPSGPLGEHGIGLGITGPDDRIKMESSPGVESRPSTFRRHHSATPISRRKRTSRSRSSTEVTEFRCSKCLQYFQRNYNLQKHQITHNPNREKNHECPEDNCNLKFDRKADCLRHVQSVHLRSKPFRCHSCNACFDRKDTLHRHTAQGCPKRETVARKGSSHHHYRETIPIRQSRPDLLHPSHVSPMPYVSEPYHHSLQH